MPIHNNFVERQIKQYALGRKLWMLCYDKVGAQASANLFSLVMTARANAVEPFEYLSYLFEHLPTAVTVEAIEALLPWNVRSTLEARRKRSKDAPQIAITRPHGEIDHLRLNSGLSGWTLLSAQGVRNDSTTRQAKEGTDR